MIFGNNANKSHINTHDKNLYFWTNNFLLIEQHFFSNIVIGNKNQKKKLILTDKISLYVITKKMSSMLLDNTIYIFKYMNICP